VTVASRSTQTLDQDHDDSRPALIQYLENVAPSLLSNVNLSDWTARDGAFLSVLLRTTGNRPQALEETLLCLAAQTSRDFHILLLVHNATETQLHETSELIESFDALSDIPTRVIEVSGGSRGLPILVGIDEATTRCAVMLDDDDYVAANWIETFRDLEAEAPGRLLRVKVASREMGPTSGALGPARVAMTGPTVEFGASWSATEHALVNRTPNMGFAFPLFPFRHLGFRMNDDLPVVEDWELLLRMAALCGVRDSDEVTAIYNKHVTDSAMSGIPERDWRDTEELVRSRVRYSLVELSELVGNAKRLEQAKGHHVGLNLPGRKAQFRYRLQKLRSAYRDGGLRAVSAALMARFRARY
jgi:glycosyltransferase involved in cell wall biosynthesis